MCSFTTARAVDKEYDSYIEKDKTLSDILSAMTKVEASCLSTHYWAILPFRLGAKHIVKYRLVPDGAIKGAPFNDTDYLALDLQQRLRNKPSKFRFEIQVRTDGQTMPLDDAQVVWSTEQSPYLCIAELNFPQQDICAIGQPEFGNNLSFNIWRTLRRMSRSDLLLKRGKKFIQQAPKPEIRQTDEIFRSPINSTPPLKGIPAKTVTV